ncbi:uncharacterized protein OCT59_017016 [Rhizophagus irregularis]|uniref:Uncharacterized protein n=2 Tax=Rhizophagus irregularis TaxID=588596 RepID=A0A015JFN8_RHIIW|nr:hypothetical protein GLOIN_2v1602307 [Rhizophagus irregularis DAOM 181602=DAOM 197198]EXX68327.1 hypothetical protein RirG_106220 [Rhizophagus irregularis DAOM 197198w]UZO24722.1 hypothetical protein OCT59_017016 [Rhizophagus irregularis]POG71749.1 hypothetical protein GLOIN_2v1602307 [Rhizophagus irregularis DAOM 181602=DAOM 197198]CAG8565885.1 3957_t:CDS:1 [Rhizophagus irregularis]GBC14642.1 hypothetical protein GLOIN_2v1602307 [Rhizophagus irregularis DAOM 181602=DAOM 197198]|eukprot:XP_025178615.1 hypothetical protein GLOIN_2v1602307 [Rhizophagus irregularis DAOM 181602=DAOM 197198]
MSDGIVRVRACTNIEQLTQLTSSASNYSNDNFRMAFFYNPPEDYQIYHITCESRENVDPLSNHTFYYNLDDKIFYQITCRLISHSLIVQFLNKKIHGIELRQNEEPQQEFLNFSNFQRDNLEFHLKEFLFNKLASKQINKEPDVNVLTCSEVDKKIIVQPKL